MVAAPDPLALPKDDLKNAVHRNAAKYNGAGSATPVDPMFNGDSPDSVLPAVRAAIAALPPASNLRALTPLLEKLTDHEIELLGFCPELTKRLPQSKDRDELIASIPKRGETVFTPISIDELIQRPPKPWLIENIIGPGELGMVFGAPGAGKSFVVIDLLFSAALAVKWAERFWVTRPLTVAYAAEEGLGGLPQRFKAAAEGYGKVPGNIHFFERIPKLFANIRDGLPEQYITRFIRDWQTNQENGVVGQLDLLVIDTLHSASAGGDENSAGFGSIITESMKMVSQQLGAAVIVVHHTNKSGESERGTSSIRAAMDSVISVKTAGEGEQRIMYCEKLKDGAEWPKQAFTLSSKAESVQVLWGEVGADIKTGGKGASHKERIVSTLQKEGEPLTVGEIIERAVPDLSKTHVTNLMSELERDGKVTVSKRDPHRDKSSRNPFVYSA